MRTTSANSDPSYSSWSRFKSFPVRQQEGQLDITLEMDIRVNLLVYWNITLSCFLCREYGATAASCTIWDGGSRKIVELNIAPDYKDGIQSSVERRLIMLSMIYSQWFDWWAWWSSCFDLERSCGYELGQHIAGIAEYLREHGMAIV